jgi:hypothetical protein
MKEELFNLRHAQLRNVIERIFGVLKHRFRILQTAPQFNFETQTILIPILCALHNFIRSRVSGEEDIFYQEADREQEEAFHLGRTSMYGPTKVEGTSDSCSHDNIHEIELRDTVAEKMWFDYVHHLSQKSK